MAPRLSQKDAGAYYTPQTVAAMLVQWAVRSEADRLLDPSCGDGRFIAEHRNSVGIEQDALATQEAMARAPWALVHEGDFFAWAAETTERFECVAGNPPFIRYQRFTGPVRQRALDLCGRLGAQFSGLASSWVLFLVAAASLLRPGGRMAFVVPAEIGHAPYAIPLVEYLTSNFATVQIVAVKEKLFPQLSEDCWLLFAEGFGGQCDSLRFTTQQRLSLVDRPPRRFESISLREWRGSWAGRLRPFLMERSARELYSDLRDNSSVRLGDIASVGIGYVSGANDFFHLRPSEARKRRIPARFLHPTVRNGRALPNSRINDAVVSRWRRDDEPMLLLKLPKSIELPRSIVDYLDTDEGHEAREAYKCRVRDPWFSVPDVQVPDFFLSYMSGSQPSLVRNDAGCTCTNSVHAVRLKNDVSHRPLRTWGSDFVQLSCELEGHPLGGGMLKLEPREASSILLPTIDFKRDQQKTIAAATATLRSWRHSG